MICHVGIKAKKQKGILSWVIFYTDWPWAQQIHSFTSMVCVFMNSYFQEREKVVHFFCARRRNSVNVKSRGTGMLMFSEMEYMILLLHLHTLNISVGTNAQHTNLWSWDSFKHNFLNKVYFSSWLNIHFIYATQRVFYPPPRKLVDQERYSTIENTFTSRKRDWVWYHNVSLFSPHSCRVDQCRKLVSLSPCFPLTTFMHKHEEKNIDFRDSARRDILPCAVERTRQKKIRVAREVSLFVLYIICTHILLAFIGRISGTSWVSQHL